MRCALLYDGASARAYRRSLQVRPHDTPADPVQASRRGTRKAGRDGHASWIAIWILKVGLIGLIGTERYPPLTADLVLL